MNGPGQIVSRPPVGRWRVLCVLGLLVGLLGMHGLAPGATHADHSSRTRSTAVAAAAHDGCSDNDCGGGHVRHADAACASAAVSGGPVLPAPVPDPVGVVVAADVVRTSPAVDPEGARAPPSLAELQLLRI